MTESFLTTDIIVIIVLVVVLVLVGVCAFLTHFYWTKIGISEIWNTAKWSSMRSSFYRTMRRFSRASSAKSTDERPFSAASRVSENPVNNTLPAPLRQKRADLTSIDGNPPRSIEAQPARTANPRRNSSNQIQPVSSVSYQQSSRGPSAARAEPAVVIHTRNT